MRFGIRVGGGSDFVLVVVVLGVFFLIVLLRKFRWVRLGFVCGFFVSFYGVFFTEWALTRAGVLFGLLLRVIGFRVFLLYVFKFSVLVG